MGAASFFRRRRAGRGLLVGEPNGLSRLKRKEPTEEVLLPTPRVRRRPDQRQSFLVNQMKMAY